MHRTFASSLWSAITPPLDEFPKFAGADRFDVAVVGAGILGLSLTLHLAEAGVRVALLEKDQPGFGASGRNTGFVVPSFPGGISPGDLETYLGREKAETLAAFVGASGHFLFRLVRRLNLDCSAEQNGWLQPSHTAANDKILEERVRQWEGLGHSLRLLDRKEAQRLTGSPQYRSALLDPSGGQINPLGYVRSLARAARSAGASLFFNSPVTTLTPENGKWTLTLDGGTVSADKVFCTTNALVGGLLPTIRKSIFTARPYQVATQPLDETVRARILPRRQPVADLHRHTFAYRWSPDNRLVTGGLAMFNGADTHLRMGDYFKARLHRYLPDLPHLETAYTWGGVVAVTDKHIPRIWEVGPGLYAPIGCNGRGVAITTALGARLAQFISTNRTDALPIGVSQPTPKLYRTALAFGPSVWLGWNRTLDWVDDRSSTRGSVKPG